MHAASGVYSALAVFVLFLHALFIVWVIFGGIVTDSRQVLRWLHIVSLVWGILTELLPWPCPLTVLEKWLETKAGVEPYNGGFLLHYLDGLSRRLVHCFGAVGVIICILNLAFHGQQLWSARSTRIENDSLMLLR